MPTFMIHQRDRADVAEARRAATAAHLDYVARYRTQIVFGGPLWAADGRTRVGGLTVLEAADLAAAEAFVAEDPFTVAGVTEVVALHPMRVMIPEAAAGELERTRARAAARQTTSARESDA